MRRSSRSPSTAEGEGRDQRLIFRTNLDEIVTAAADHPLRVETADGRRRPRPISWCGPGSRRGSLGRYFTSWSSWAGRSGSAAKSSSAYGAAACFSGSAIRATKWTSRLAAYDRLPGEGRDPFGRHSGRDCRSDHRSPPARGLGKGLIEEMTRARLIELLAGRPAGRRGFGGSADPEEAAAFRAWRTARRPRPHPGYDAAEHGAAAGRGAGAADRPSRTAWRCC